MKVIDVEQTEPNFEVPPGACDCHVHLFGATQDFPLVEERQYTPPPIRLEELSALQKVLRLDRAVAVQASVQGTDNSFLMHELLRAPDSLRGVAVIGDDISDAELQRMDEAGFRGIRLNFESYGIHDPVLAGEKLVAAATKVAPLGWHVQMYVNAELVAALADRIRDLPCPVVFDHFGRMPSAEGLAHSHFQTLVRLLESGQVYVKLSGPHRVTSTADYEDVAPMAAALANANPERVLWGSDWPHVLAFKDRNPNGPDPLRPEDDGANLNRLARWIANEDTLRRLLVENPERLYRF